MSPQALLAVLGLKATGAPTRLSGGDMGEVYRVGELVLKTHPSPPPGLYPAEARGLARLLDLLGTEQVVAEEDVGAIEVADEDVVASVAVDVSGAGGAVPAAGGEGGLERQPGGGGPPQTSPNLTSSHLLESSQIHSHASSTLR